MIQTSLPTTETPCDDRPPGLSPDVATFSHRPFISLSVPVLLLAATVVDGGEDVDVDVESKALWKLGVSRRVEAVKSLVRTLDTLSKTRAPFARTCMV